MRAATQVAKGLQCSPEEPHGKPLPGAVRQSAVRGHGNDIGPVLSQTDAAACGLDVGPSMWSAGIALGPEGRPDPPCQQANRAVTLRGIDVTAERAWSASVSHACCAVSVGLAVATMPGDDGHRR